jgi:hypothetical protein
LARPFGRRFSPHTLTLAPRQPLPNISEDDLIDLAGGATVLLAKELVAKGKVKSEYD